MAYDKTFPSSGGSVTYSWNLSDCYGSLTSSDWVVTQSQTGYFNVTFNDSNSTVQISAGELSADSTRTVTLTPKIGSNSCSNSTITVTQQGQAPTPSCPCSALTLNQPSPEPTPEPPTCGCDSISRTAATIDIAAPATQVTVYTLNEPGCWNALSFSCNPSAYCDEFVKQGNNVIANITENSSITDDRSMTVSVSFNGSVCSGKDVTINQERTWADICGPGYWVEEVDANGNFVYGSSIGFTEAYGDEKEGDSHYFVGQNIFPVGSIEGDCKDNVEWWVYDHTEGSGSAAKWVGSKDYAKYGLANLELIEDDHYTDLYNVWVTIMPYADIEIKKESITIYTTQEGYNGPTGRLIIYLGGYNNA